MREILFRGKRKDNGEWVEGLLKIHLVDGDLTQKEKEYYITVQWMDEIGKVYRVDHEVIPETVGQWTGLTDKNGVKIFEGDVVRYYSDGRMYVPTENGGWALKGDPAIEEKTVVEYEENCGCYVIHKSVPLADLADIVEVIASIYDNPELLEGAAE